MKFSAYYFHVKTNILADFQICISVPLTSVFLDISETFVIVVWCAILKIEPSGTFDNFLNTLTDYLKDRKQIIPLNEFFLLFRVFNAPYHDHDKMAGWPYK